MNELVLSLFPGIGLLDMAFEEEGGGGCHGRKGDGMKRKRKAWTEYPRRICRWLNECAICRRDIVGGEDYYNGGHGRRAHVVCVEDVKEEQKAK